MAVCNYVVDVADTTTKISSPVTDRADVFTYVYFADQSMVLIAVGGEHFHKDQVHKYE